MPSSLWLTIFTSQRTWETIDFGLCRLQGPVRATTNIRIVRLSPSTFRNSGESVVRAAGLADAKWLLNMIWSGREIAFALRPSQTLPLLTTWCKVIFSGTQNSSINLWKVHALRCRAHGTLSLSSDPHMKKQDVVSEVIWCSVFSHVNFPFTVCVSLFIYFFFWQVLLKCRHPSVLRHRTMAPKVSWPQQLCPSALFKIDLLFLPSNFSVRPLHQWHQENRASWVV